VSEACADTFVSLPMYPELNDDQIAAVVAALEAELGARDAREHPTSNVQHPTSKV
jgi:hypothetical protein